MKREIKFRAWDRTENKYCNPVLNNVDFNDLFNLPFYDYQQYTGLKDKNGKDIYEGDIVKRPSSNGTKGQMAYGKIDFYKGAFVFICNNSNTKISVISVDLLVYHYADCEVIGNLYETPELLDTNQL